MKCRQQFASPERDGLAAKVPDIDWGKSICICQEDSRMFIQRYGENPHDQKLETVAFTEEPRLIVRWC